MPFEIQPSPEIDCREDFPILCIWRKFRKVIEVGVDRAEFSQIFLNRWADYGDLYLGIDPYEPYGEMFWDRSGDFQIAAMRYERYAAKAKLIKSTSEYVAGKIRDMGIVDTSVFNGMYGAPFDFVYIDGGHEKRDVTRDLNAWWPIISDRGVIAGHDWGMLSGEHQGVQEAVTQFAKDKDLTVYFTDDDPQSWYCYKNGIPNAAWRRI